MKAFVLVYFLSTGWTNGGIATAHLEFKNLFSCEQAAAQIRAAVAQHPKLEITTVCLDREAHEMHFKGKPIQPGTGKVGK